MNVSLTPRLEKFSKDKIKNGRYHSASEVVRDALRLLEVREWRRDELQRAVEVGLEQLDRGEGRPFDKQLVDEVESRGRKRLAQYRKRNGRR